MIDNEIYDLTQTGDEVQAILNNAQGMPTPQQLSDAFALKANASDVYTKNETYTKTEVNRLVGSPDQNYVTVEDYASLPATGSTDTIYRVANYDGENEQVDMTMYSEYAWNGTSYTLLCVKSQIGEVFDISDYNDATYADLSAALGADGANVPQSIRRGGMSIKFIQSSDNKYVQYQLMSRYWSTDKQDWKFSPDIKGSNNDFTIRDENYNAIVIFNNGHIKTKHFDSSIPKETEVKGSSKDFSIRDENNNAIVVFENGHIKTKNFDSDYFSKRISTEKFRNKKIAIIGDSISTYAGWLPSSISGYDGATYATYYPNGDVNSVDKTWWYIAAKMLGLTPERDVNNCAWSGSQVTGNSEATDTAKPGCSTRRVSDLSIRGYNPDIVLIYISCNDWGSDVPIGSWQVTDAIPSEGVQTTLRDAYSLMINKIHVAYPFARVFCCTNLDETIRDRVPGWPSNNTNGVSTYQWNQNIMEVANALGCDIIDMHRCGVNYANISHYVVDAGLHPNAAGHALMAQKVVSELIAKY